MAVGSFLWVRKYWLKVTTHQVKLAQFKGNCSWNLEYEEPVAIQEIIAYFIEVLA